MKEVNKENIKLALEFYLKEAKKTNYFFDGTSKDEENYLNHHEDRYFCVLKKLEKLINRDLCSKVEIHILELGFSPMSFLIRYFLDQEKLTILDHNHQFKVRVENIGCGFMHSNLSQGFEIEAKFDIIIFNEVLEHLFCDEFHLLKMISRSLKKKGYLLFSTPNYFSLRNIILFLTGSHLGALNKDIINTDGNIHIREYSVKELALIFSEVKDLEIIEFRYERYFENLKTLLVYRKNKVIAIIPMMIYSLITFFIPQFRIGISILCKKVN